MAPADLGSFVVMGQLGWTVPTHRSFGFLAPGGDASHGCDFWRERAIAIFLSDRA